MIKSPKLELYYEAHKLGELSQSADHAIEFGYDESWLKHSKKFPISQSLPLALKKYRREAQNFFANLLPEGDVRLATASKLGISPENDFRLLEALGGECAGALTIGHDHGDPLAAPGERFAYQRKISVRNSSQHD